MNPTLLIALAGLLTQPPPAETKLDPPKPAVAEPEKGGVSVGYNPGADLARVAANHPDVRVAEARLAEAQAMLAQARLKVAIELATNQGKLDTAKADVKLKQSKYDNTKKLAGSGAQEVLQFQTELDAAKAALAAVQATVDATIQAAPPPTPNVSITQNGLTLEAQSLWLSDAVNLSRSVTPAAKSPAQGQTLRDILTKKVKFAVKPGETPAVTDKIQDSVKTWGFPEAGLIVRTPQFDNNVVKVPPTVFPVEGENTVGSWLLLMLDDLNAQPVGNYQFYVREYGLLLTVIGNGPDDAPTLAQFLRATPFSVPLPKAEKAPEPARK